MECGVPSTASVHLMPFHFQVTRIYTHKRIIVLDIIKCCISAKVLKMLLRLVLILYLAESKTVFIHANLNYIIQYSTSDQSYSKV